MNYRDYIYFDLELNWKEKKWVSLKKFFLLLALIVILLYRTTKIINLEINNEDRFFTFLFTMYPMILSLLLVMKINTNKIYVKSIFIFLISLFVFLLVLNIYFARGYFFTMLGDDFTVYELIITFSTNVFIIGHLNTNNRFKK